LNFNRLPHANNLEIVPAIGLPNLHEGVLGLESLVFIGDLPPFGPAEQFENPALFKAFAGTVIELVMVISMTIRPDVTHPTRLLSMDGKFSSRLLLFMAERIC
jgi:hypothetical protein